MPDLQTAFYIIAIIYMAIMFLIMIGIVIAVFIIKAKIDAIHRRVEERLHMITAIAHAGSDIVNAAKKAVGRH